MLFEAEVFLGEKRRKKRIVGGLWYGTLENND